MANEIKFGYISGQQLVFSAYRPNGTGRGIQNQPLDEVATGYYAGSPLTDLQAGDEIIAAILNNVVSGVSRVSVLRYDSIVSDGVRVSSDGNWVITKDSTSMQPVVSVGSVVGANEYTANADWFDSLKDSVDDLVIGQNKVVPVYMPSDVSGGAVAQAQRARELAEADIGYFRRKRIERYG